jgi:hypothetical protein
MRRKHSPELRPVPAAKATDTRNSIEIRRNKKMAAICSPLFAHGGAYPNLSAPMHNRESREMMTILIV